MFISIFIYSKPIQILFDQISGNNMFFNQSNQSNSLQPTSSTQNTTQQEGMPRSSNIFGRNSNQSSNNLFGNISTYHQNSTNNSLFGFSQQKNTNMQYNSNSMSFKQGIFQSQQPLLRQNTLFGQYIPQQRSSFNGFFSNIDNNPFGTNKRLKLGNQIYNDDQIIQETAKVQSKQNQSERKIEFKVISLFQQLGLNSSQTLPCLCSIKGTGGVRASVDIICVIDMSRSKSGQKMALVRDTMRYVVKTLSSQDRLSIVICNSQGTRLCPFKFVNQSNKSAFQAIIDKLYSGGGNNMGNCMGNFMGNSMLNGLEVAVKILRERKTANEVSSIFLLSDGQQPHDTDARFKQMLEKKQNQNIGSFSLHSFGFGADHDENLMTKVCSMKDGNFYFINKLSSLDQTFCNALGGIITQTASDIHIKVQCIPGPIQGVSIQKVYGEKWQKIDEKTYKIEINQIMSEASKDFIFELFIPKTQLELLDVVRSLQVLKATFTAVGNNGKQLQGESLLKLQILNDNEIMKRQSNSEVIEGYLRIKAVEIMKDSITLAEKGQFDLAKKQIDNFIEMIKYYPNIRKEKIKGIVEDLELVKQKCTKPAFANQGKKEMVNLWYPNSRQSSFQYANVCQQQMLFNLKAGKNY